MIQFRALLPPLTLLAGLLFSMPGASLAQEVTARDTQPRPPRAAGTPTTVLFMCPHGAAKSVLASAYFARLARERGLNVRIDAAGTHPDAAVAPAVAQHLAKTGHALPVAKPRSVTAADFQAADIVVSLGCDLSGLPAPRGELRKWDDVPGPGEDFAGADEAIRQKVIALVEELAARPDVSRLPHAPVR